MFEKTKAFLDSFVEMGVPGFDFQVYKDGKPFFRYTGGYNDLENQIPINGNELYCIYSCTKPITVTAAMQLWEQGKFSLDDPLSDYLPAYKECVIQTENGPIAAKNPIYIRNLFTMTAGFAYNYRSEQMKKLLEQIPCPTTRQVADALSKDLIFEPGDHYHYSICHDVLGALIEVVSGERFQDYVKNHIFDPLGMTRSTMDPTEETLKEMAVTYQWDPETKTPFRRGITERFGPNYISGGASCITTMDDYMKFAEALCRGEKLLKRSTIERMSTNQLTEHQIRTFTIHNMGYGLGLWTPTPGQLRQDFGWGGAAGALLAVDPGRGLSLVHLQHMHRAPTQKLRAKLIRTFIAELEGVEDTGGSDYKRNDLTY